VVRVARIDYPGVYGAKWLSTVLSGENSAHLSQWFGLEDAVVRKWLSAIGKYFKLHDDGIVIHEHDCARRQWSDIPACDVLIVPNDQGLMMPVEVYERASLVCRRSVDPHTLTDDDLVMPAFPRFDVVATTPAPMVLPFRVSFMGVADRPVRRRQMIEVFGRCDDLNVQIVHRDRFHAPYRNDYRRLMAWTHFVLCPRGIGNYSYRLYETLASGRIPIIHADHPLPDGPDWDSLVLRVSDEALADPKALSQCVVAYADKHGVQSQRIHTEWGRWLSPPGFFLYLASVIEKRMVTA